MSRTSVSVRDAVEADVSALLELWRDLLPRAGVEIVGVPMETSAAEALARVQGSPELRVLVAEVGGVLAGAVFLRIGLVSPLHTDRTVYLSHLHVAPAFERVGVGRALIGAAVSWAEHLGVPALTAATTVGDRDANRFLARLGLAQVAALRVGSVASLRGRMPHDPSAAARAPRRAGRTVGQVVAARRTQLRSRSRGSVS